MLGYQLFRLALLLLIICWVWALWEIKSQRSSLWNLGFVIFPVFSSLLFSFPAFPSFPLSLSSSLLFPLSYPPLSFFSSLVFFLLLWQRKSITQSKLVKREIISFYRFQSVSEEIQDHEGKLNIGLYLSSLWTRIFIQCSFTWLGLYHPQ